MWMPLTCFQVAVPSCWDICTCQWDQRDFGPSTNTTSLHRSFRRIYTFWQSNHAKSMENPWKIRKSMENPWKIHGTSENPRKIHGKSMEISAEFPSFRNWRFFLDGNNFQVSAAAWRSPLRRPWSLKTRTRYFFMSSLILAKQSVTWILCHQKYQKCHANI